jgi:hypothetical protein
VGFGGAGGGLPGFLMVRLVGVGRWVGLGVDSVGYDVEGHVVEGGVGYGSDSLFWF